MRTIHAIRKKIETTKVWPLLVVFYLVLMVVIGIIWFLTLCTATINWFYREVCLKLDRAMDRVHESIDRWCSNGK